MPDINTEIKTEKKQKDRRGVSMRRLNVLMVVLAIVISLLLLITSARSSGRFAATKATAEDYIRRQNAAYDLQVGSDYLTEQVRCFAVTGEKEYLDNYFEEAKVTRRRDKAIATLAEDLEGTETYENLAAAMDTSVALMDREYYSMRLAAEAFGYDISGLPEEISSVVLDPKDAALNRNAKAELARSMVFDDIYSEQKAAISGSMQKCLDSLAEMTTEAMGVSSGQMQKSLRTEQWMIIALIGVVVLIVLLTLFLIIKPLIEAVVHVRGDQPIPDKGSSEFRFLARTYNRMYESNHESQEKLAYEANHDQLTGLFNRNAFESLRREADSSLDALLLFDVDKFKNVNDTYGHEVGDRVLIKVAEVVRGMFRASDHLCRIGGDEFAVIMVASGRGMTAQIKSKIDRINAILTAPEDDLPPVSISAGLAFGGVGRDSMVIYKDADAALYSVKNSGGCGCAVAGEEA